MPAPMSKDKFPRVVICTLLVIVVVSFLVAALGVMSTSALANSNGIIYSSCGIPIIDGNLSTIEWSDATTITVPMIGPDSAGSLTTTLHIMNSANNLYMGFTINDDEFSLRAKYLTQGDVFIVNFDNDLSGSIYELENNVLSLSAAEPQFQDNYIYHLPSSSQLDIVGGGAEDGAGVASRVADSNHFELRFPLCSGDSLDFCLQPLDSVGFRLEYLDAEGDEEIPGIPYLYPGNSDTSIVELVIGSCSTVPDQFIHLPLITR